MDYKKWQRELKAKKIVSVLNEKGYTAVYAESGMKAFDLVDAYIPAGSTIGFGGSMTLKQYGITDHLLSEKYKAFNRYDQPDFESEVECYRQSMLAQYFVTGVNAITMDGELMCTDSSGNRAAAVVFGPEKVVIVAGANKIVKDVSEGMKRMKDIAPMNCKRLGHRTPCAESGICEECEIPDSMCNFISIVNNGRKFGRYYIIITPDEVGF